MLTLTRTPLIPIGLHLGLRTATVAVALAERFDEPLQFGVAPPQDAFQDRADENQRGLASGDFAPDGNRVACAVC